jgi:hypothetical protein
MRLQDVRFKSLSARLGAGVLGVVLGSCAIGMAQDQPKEDARPQEARPEEARPQDARPEGAKPQEAKPQEARPQEAHPEEAKPQRDQAPGKAEEARPGNNGRDDRQNNNDRQNGEMRQGHDHAAGGDHATTSDRRIPDDKFRSNFGRQHTFRVQTTVVEGQPRFQYGGFWFALANPWPGDWAYTDDCYIDYIDGEYVLIDLRHPGVMIPVIVVVG